MRIQFKSVFLPLCGAVILGAGAMMAGCSVNPATGEKQFAALMSPQQEASVGAQEHEKIIKQFGGLVTDSSITSYVSRVGQKVAADTERPDVEYKFYVLDTPVANAFALPGGYIYVTRGVLALANSEAELAAVLAHEVGHVTGRHTAERYSHSVVTSLGAAVLAAALDSKSAAEALNMGNQLYITSYSRGQETQADDLGIRYLHRAGYDTNGMARFLSSLEMETALSARIAGKNGADGAGYFSTHPQTAERVAHARNVAAGYPANDKVENRSAYMNAVQNLVYGDSAEQGFVRGTTFWHPQMEFTFTAPDGYVLANNPNSIIARDAGNATVAIFDTAKNAANTDMRTFLTQVWMKNEPLSDVETITIGGKPAATGRFTGRVGNQVMEIQLVAVAWDANTVYRFQMAWPAKSSASVVDGLKKMSYSLRPITATEKKGLKPLRIQTVTAKAGDTVASLSSRMAKTDNFTVDRFLTINALQGNDNIIAGQVYKIVTE